MMPISKWLTIYALVSLLCAIYLAGALIVMRCQHCTTLSNVAAHSFPTVGVQFCWALVGSALWRNSNECMNALESFKGILVIQWICIVAAVSVLAVARLQRAPNNSGLN